jgi:hypothetical protein
MQASMERASRPGEQRPDPCGPRNRSRRPRRHRQLDPADRDRRRQQPSACFSIAAEADCHRSRRWAFLTRPSSSPILVCGQGER